MPSMFNLIPPSDVAPQVCVQWIETAATKLLDNSLFLQDGFDENISILSPSAIQFPFSVWLSLQLQFAKNGTGKMMPQFSSKAYNSIFHGMMKVLNNILCNPYHGAKEGWAALQEANMNVERYQHIQAVLD
ncbi:hypothetical protein BKA82DRAFT_4015170 [Pisolithus tinctorius]|nr:hypothetical protein BKA82DRAFT_4015170 [Pisolithus tinctorius]